MDLTKLTELEDNLKGKEKEKQDFVLNLLYLDLIGNLCGKSLHENRENSPHLNYISIHKWR
ncbi:MAG: hypothetical protein ACOYT4_04845 [Nanoarchaeota archaeon]